MFSCCKAKDGSEPTKKSDAPAVEKKEEAPAEGEAPAEAAPEAEVAAEWNSKFSSRDAFHIAGIDEWICYKRVRFFEHIIRL